MKPYYAEAGVTLYHGDAREVIPQLEPPALILADPPYDLWSEVGPAVFAAGARATVAYTSPQHRPSVERAAGGPARAEIVWQFQPGRWIAHHLPRITHALMLVYTAEQREAYVGPAVFDRRPQSKGAGSVGRDTYAKHIYRPRDRKLLESVLEAPRPVRSGVWSKPAAVISPFIEWLTDPGEIVLDPFTGTGAVLRTAKRLGRKAIGIERDEATCEAARESLRQAVMDLT